MERHVRPVFVVPTHQQTKFLRHRRVAQWNQHGLGQCFFHRSDQSFDHGDAPVLANRTEMGTNAASPTPDLYPAVGQYWLPLSGGTSLAVPEEHTVVAGICRMTSTSLPEFEPQNSISFLLPCRSGGPIL
jgi:hypothetical protein